MKSQRPVQISVAGPSDAADLILDRAHDVGALLAKRGATLVVGGAGGVSEAAACTAAEHGGLVIHFLPESEVSAAYPGATIAVPTGMGEASNTLVVCAADAMLAVGGGWGTLSEVALAFRVGIPVIALGGWQLRDDHGAPIDGPVTAPTPAQAVNLACAAARRRRAYTG